MVRNCFVLKKIDEAPSFIERRNGICAGKDSEGNGGKGGQIKN